MAEIVKITKKNYLEQAFLSKDPLHKGVVGVSTINIGARHVSITELRERSRELYEKLVRRGNEKHKKWNIIEDDVI
jgi:hypothetical protein